MRYVELDAQPSLDEPIVVAAFGGWNDAGDAATTTARVLVSHADGQEIGSIRAEEFYDFTTARPLVRLDDDGSRTIEWPETQIWACPSTDGSPDLLVVIGLEPQLRWRTFCAQILDVAEHFGASMVVTLGALLADVPHTRPTQVYGTTDDVGLRDRLGLAHSTYEGPTGIIGALNLACLDRGLDTVSLWASVPSYVPSAPSPKAALALLEGLGDIFGHELPATDLEIASAEYERQVDELVEDDDETAAYVRNLEDAYDNEPDEAPLTTEPEAADELVAEVERFLRDQN